MKKRFIIMTILFSLILASINVSMATEDIITFEADKTNVKVNDKFTVTIKQGYGNDSESIEGNIEYDDAFELLEVKNKEWSNFGPNNTTIQALPMQGAPESVLIYEFNAKSNVTDGKITFKNIKVSVLENGVSNLKTLEDKSVSITVADEQNVTPITLTGISIKNKPATTTYTAGSIFDPAGMEITAAYSNGTEKTVTTYTYSPSEELKTTDKEITISYTENGITKTVKQPITVNAINNAEKEEQKQENKTNNTTATNTSTTNTAVQADTTTSNASTLPKTGSRTILLVVTVVGLILMGIVSYKGYKKYKDI